MAFDGLQFGQSLAGAVVFLQGIAVFIKAAQCLLQLLPAVQLVGEELVEVTVVLFEVEVIVRVVDHLLEEIDAIAVAQQTLQGQ